MSNRVTLPDGWEPRRIRRYRPGKDEDVLAVAKDGGKWWWNLELTKRHGPFDTMDLAIADAEKCNP